MRLAIKTIDLSKSYRSQRKPSVDQSAAADESAAPGTRPPHSPRNGEVVALDNLNLEVGEGEFFGLLGRNGAGKTTTIGILTTRVRATGGNAYVLGFDVEKSPTRVKQQIGVVPQKANADHGLTVEENLQFHAAYFALNRGKARRRARELLERFDLSGCAGGRVTSLSAGQHQRLMIARALMHDPAILFLDEPTVGLDPSSRRTFWQLLVNLHAEGRTIVMTTHYMQEAEELCQRVAILECGRLVCCDTPRSLIELVHAETEIIVTFAGHPGRLIDRVRHIEGVLRIGVEGAEMHLFAISAGPVVAAVAVIASNEQLAVHDIRVLRPGLDAVFLGLTQRGISAR